MQTEDTYCSWERFKKPDEARRARTNLRCKAIYRQRSEGAGNKKEKKTWWLCLTGTKEGREEELDKPTRDLICSFNYLRAGIRRTSFPLSFQPLFELLMVTVKRSCFPSCPLRGSSDFYLTNVWEWWESQELPISHSISSNCCKLTVDGFIYVGTAVENGWAKWWFSFFRSQTKRRIDITWEHFSTVPTFKASVYGRRRWTFSGKKISCFKL